MGTIWIKTFIFPELVVLTCSAKKTFLEILQNLQENTCAIDSFLIKFQAVTSVKKNLWHRCFPVNFAKFLRASFFCRTPPASASIFLIPRSLKLIIWKDTNHFVSIKLFVWECQILLFKILKFQRVSAVLAAPKKY